MNASVDNYPGHAPACRLRTDDSVCTCLPREGRQVATTTDAVPGHTLARKLLEGERDQAAKDIADATDWIQTYTRELAEHETRRANAVSALEWLDELEAGERR
jgi:hypothetical protein